MSHEIRTPLNAIVGYAEILQRRDRLDIFERDAVRTIAGSSNHLLHLINEILDLSKIDAGRMEVVRAEFDLHALVREVVAMFQPLCENKHLTLRVDNLDVVPARAVVGDAGKLRQVLINLVGNAVKFTEAGAVTLRLMDLTDGQLRFEVEDTGPGIPLELRDRLFEPFQQGRSSGEMRGTGLGLSIAHRHVTLMGGDLELEASAEAGSRFSINLPLPSAQIASRSDGMTVVTHRLSAGQHVRALVVDDGRENRDVLSTMLGMAGCETAVAEDCRQAIDMVCEFQPDIVFMDLRLPGLDGLETTRLARERSARPFRVVVTSASVLDGERQRCLAAGCDEFIAKPVTADRIHACVARLLDVSFEVQSSPGTRSRASAFDVSHIALPEELAARLNRAAELHSATGLRSCLSDMERLGPDPRALADHLRRLLADCDMEAIERIGGDLPAISGVGFVIMANEKILIVDDTAANVHLLANVLEPRGYEILAASNAEQGLKVAARTQPDMILLDVVMPGMDGFSVCRALKANEATQAVPVLFVTAKDEPESCSADFIAEPWTTFPSRSSQKRCSFALTLTFSSHG